MTTPPWSDPEWEALRRADARLATINRHLNSAWAFASVFTLVGLIGQVVITLDWFVIQHQDPAIAYVLAIVEALLMIILIAATGLSVLLNVIRHERKYFLFALVSCVVILAFSPALPTLIRAVPSIGGTW